MKEYFFRSTASPVPDPEPHSRFPLEHYNCHCQAAGALLERLADNSQLFLAATACELYGEKVKLFSIVECDG